MCLWKPCTFEWQNLEQTDQWLALQNPYFFVITRPNQMGSSLKCREIVIFSLHEIILWFTHYFESYPCGKSDCNFFWDIWYVRPIWITLWTFNLPSCRLLTASSNQCLLKKNNLFLFSLNFILMFYVAYHFYIIQFYQMLQSMMASFFVAHNFIKYIFYIHTREWNGFVLAIAAHVIVAW